jgi:glyoxylase-like metal-dependent hydrolase (beta-lactamase superfamily II)
MLTRVAEGVLVHESEFCQSNAVVVQGDAGVLLIDPGVHADELTCLASDLADSRQTVLAGFSTHPHWDHLLWHPGLGPAPRHATARCAATVRERLPHGVDEALAKAVGIPDQVPLELLGLVTGLPEQTAELPWDGPRVRIVEHQAHAAGHAALVIDDCGVLVAGDMLSDVLVPMLDQNAADPVQDYLDALRLLDDVADDIEIVVPGHGSVCGTDGLRTRIDQDRAYVHALREAQVPEDPRVGPAAGPGWEWVAGVHERQLQLLAAKGHNSG